MKNITDVIEIEYPEKIEWKTVVYNGIEFPYEVSNYGNIRRVLDYDNNRAYRDIKPIKVGKYLAVSMSYKGIVFREYIHRLVATAFIPIPESFVVEGYTYKTLEVNHIKAGARSKKLNVVTNLEWVTGSGNKRHDYKNGTRPVGEQSHLATKNQEFQIHMVCKLLESNKLTVKDISDRTGVNIGVVYDILYGGSWTSVSDLYKISNYTPKNKKNLKYGKKEVLDMYKSGKSMREISDLTGIKYGTVWYYVRGK